MAVMVGFCEAMPGGQWDEQRQLCVTQQDTYTTSQLVEAAEHGDCPSGQVMTPQGCQLAVAVEPPPPQEPPPLLVCPPGTELTKVGCIKTESRRDANAAVVGAVAVIGVVVLWKILT